MEAIFIETLSKQRTAQRGFSPERSFGTFRHMVLSSKQKMQVEAYNQLWFLLDEPSGVRISSSYGDYDLSNFVADSQQHEHTDQIEIENLTGKPVNVRFYQVFLRK